MLIKDQSEKYFTSNIDTLVSNSLLKLISIFWFILIEITPTHNTTLYYLGCMYNLVSTPILMWTTRPGKEGVHAYWNNFATLGRVNYFSLSYLDNAINIWIFDANYPGLVQCINWYDEHLTTKNLEMGGITSPQTPPYSCTSLTVCLSLSIMKIRRSNLTLKIKL